MRRPDLHLGLLVGTAATVVWILVNMGLDGEWFAFLFLLGHAIIIGMMTWSAIVISWGYKNVGRTPLVSAPRPSLAGRRARPGQASI